MDSMVTTGQVERVLQVLRFAMPVCGMAVGAVVGWVKGRLAQCTVCGLLAGLVGAGVFELWRYYNVLGHRSGYANLHFIGVQMGVFLAFGVVVGTVIHKATDGKLDQRTEVFQKAKSTQEDKLNA